MRLVELFLCETTEEDRAIVSLSSAIYRKLQQYIDVEDQDFEPDDEYDLEMDIPRDDISVITVGKIGDLFVSPIPAFDKITIELQSTEGMRKRSKDKIEDESLKAPNGVTAGLWYAYNSTMVLNKDLIDTSYLKTIISHELRHALDDIRSDYETSRENSKYTTPKIKSHRANDDTRNMSYYAQPAEINARFLQVLDGITPFIKRMVTTYDEGEAREQILQKLNTLMKSFKIDMVYPERTESKDYKRLMKRAVDYIDKEVAYLKGVIE
jgi:hypothetical protein